MNILAIIHFLAFIGDICLIVLVIVKNPKARLNRLCALLSAVFAIWSLSYYFIHVSSTPDSALFWINISAISWLAFPIISLYFYLSFANKEKIVNNTPILLAFGLYFLFFVYQQWAGNLVNTVARQTYGWAGVWSLSIYCYLLYVFYCVMTGLYLYLIYDYSRKAQTNREKRQGKVLLATASIGFSLGVVTDIILPVLRISFIPQMADIFVTIWSIGIVVCTTKYGLMSINPIVAAEQILNTMTDILILVEPSGRVKGLNYAAQNLLGFHEDEVKGTMFDSLYVSKDRSFNLLTETSKRGGNLNLELDFKTKANRTIPVIASCSAIYDRMRTNLGFIVVAKDVSEILNSQTLLRAQKELIDRILSTTPDAVLVVGGDLRVIMANHAFYQTSEKKEKEVVARPISEVLSVEAISVAISRVKSGETTNVTREFRHTFNDHERMFVANAIRMGQEEILLILDDVTEEREKQERLYLTDRLASVGEMAAGMAHELNNPLTGIIGLSEVLLDEEIPDAIKTDLRTIYSEAQRAAVVVKNLLTFARKHGVTRQPVQINEIIAEVLKLRAYEHKVNNILVTTHLDNELPQVTVDRFQMQQVFLNIVLNAEQAMIEAHEEGKLTISTKRVNGSVKIAFSDDGPGITPENMRKLFSPFFTTKEVGKGTGLGLSICYGILKAHGGQIFVESKVGNGATFIVGLPTSPGVVETCYAGN